MYSFGEKVFANYKVGIVVEIDIERDSYFIKFADGSGMLYHGEELRKL